MNSLTEQQYRAQIKACKELFLKKTADYGTSWRVMRLPSITDQIFIKAQRIRSIQDKGKQEIPDDIRGEFQGIINYCVIALIQMHLSHESDMDLSIETVTEGYTKEIEATFDLHRKKNHDYDEAWRLMRISSMTDIILMKIHRTKQIEDNDGHTLISEGVEANYRDMINYAVFCLILLEESVKAV